jgi:hypothetical protein
VRIFGAITAVYLGLYLLLPGCLCQILGVFGVQVHPPRMAGSGEYIAGEPSIMCHCHEQSPKTAEAPAGVVDLSPATDDFVFLSPESVAFSVPRAIVSEKPSRAPPPGTIPSPTLLRSFTGVFLI